MCFTMCHQIVICLTLIVHSLHDSLGVGGQYVTKVNVNDAIYSGPKTVNEGDTVQILCRMSRLEAPKWSHNDEEISESDPRFKYNFLISQVASRGEVLTITNVSLQDQGYYRCNSFSQNAYILHVIPQLNDDQMNSPVADSKLFQDLLIENSTVEIECPLESSSQKATVYWNKEGLYIEPDKRRQIFQSKLIIHNATSKLDAGEYMCRTDRMKVEQGQFGQIIQLRAAIRVKPFDQPLIQRLQGTSVRLNCQYSGYPRGKITWKIGNQPLTDLKLNNRGILLEQKEQTNDVLVIDPITMQHSDVYSCLVNNSHTFDQQRVLLQVTENIVVASDSFELKESREVRIYCNLTDNSLAHIKPKWLKDEVDVSTLPDFYDRMTVSKIDSMSWLLVIHKAKFSDVGDYTCLINNQTSMTRVRTKPLLVPFEEFQKTNYKSANIVEGERFSLPCVIVPGHERGASLKWYSYSEDLSEYHQRFVMNEINISDPRISVEWKNSTFSVLTINSVGPQDRNKYVCFSRNEIGTFNNTILLRVKDKLAALWPFLGIVCEVLILCIIIFVYEKRRVKPDFEDSNKKADESKRSPQDRASRSQDVRQRK